MHGVEEGGSVTQRTGKTGRLQEPIPLGSGLWIAHWPLFPPTLVLMK